MAAIKLANSSRTVIGRAAGAAPGHHLRQPTPRGSGVWPPRPCLETGGAVRLRCGAAQHSRERGFELTDSERTAGKPGLHFSEQELSGRRQRVADELQHRGLDGILLFRQESM